MVDRIEFQKCTDFPRGTMYDILWDAYSFDERNRVLWDDNWKESDDFFYDNPDIADKYGLVTCIMRSFCNLTNLRKTGNVTILECSYNRLRQEEKVWSG